LIVFLSSTLRRYIPGYDPDKGHEIQVQKGTTILDLCGQLNIPADMVTIIMVDGRAEDLDHVLHGSERVHLFPAIGGG
jgi:molybdopterin synthase sulfur carrier subunit